MKKVLTIIICLLISFTTKAHQDTPLIWKKNGTIEGLPKKFGKASFNATTFKLKVGKNSIVIPECIKENFNTSKDYNIHFSASWYHDTELLPYYILMTVKTKEEPFGFEICFDLNTLTIINTARPYIEHTEGKSDRYYENEQEISKECQVEISNSISSH